MRSIALVAFVGLLSSCAKTNEIGPDGTLPDGGKFDDPSDPSKPSPSDPSKAGTSGNRLKARYYKGEDGSQQFVGWYDSELKENCNFMQAFDGKLRCLPGGMSMTGWFADAGCTKRLAQTTKNCAAPAAILIVEPASTCSGAGFRVARTGSKHTGTVYSGAPASCTALGAASAPYIDPYDFYLVGSDVPLTSYVAASDTHE